MPLPRRGFGNFWVCIRSVTALDWTIYIYFSISDHVMLWVAQCLLFMHNRCNHHNLCRLRYLMQIINSSLFMQTKYLIYLHALILVVGVTFLLPHDLFYWVLWSLTLCKLKWGKVAFQDLHSTADIMVFSERVKECYPWQKVQKH